MQAARSNEIKIPAMPISQNPGKRNKIAANEMGKLDTAKGVKDKFATCELLTSRNAKLASVISQGGRGILDEKPPRCNWLLLICEYNYMIN